MNRRRIQGGSKVGIVGMVALGLTTLAGAASSPTILSSSMELSASEVGAASDLDGVNLAILICSVEMIRCHDQESWFCIGDPDDTETWLWNHCNWVCDPQDPWDCQCELPE
jgi:hypothetical protein